MLQANRAASSLQARRLDDLAETAADASHLRDALADALRDRVASMHLASGRQVSVTPLAGLALVEIGDLPQAEAPAQPMVYATGGLALEARAELQSLLGHLELLRETPLSRLQQAQLDCAIETAADLAQHFQIRPPVGSAEPALRVVPEDRVGRAARVLIVDDDATNLHVAKGMFDVLGVHADAVDNGEAALNAIGEESYDLVLLDVMMPGMGGVELTRVIRERHGQRPLIVAVTALPNARTECIEAGVDLFLTKPLRLADLSRTLDLGVAA